MYRVPGKLVVVFPVVMTRVKLSAAASAHSSHTRPMIGIPFKEYPTIVHLQPTFPSTSGVVVAQAERPVKRATVISAHCDAAVPWATGAGQSPARKPSWKYLTAKPTIWPWARQKSCESPEQRG